MNKIPNKFTATLQNSKGRVATCTDPSKIVVDVGTQNKRPLRIVVENLAGVEKTIESICIYLIEDERETTLGHWVGTDKGEIIPIAVYQESLTAKKPNRIVITKRNGVIQEAYTNKKEIIYLHDYDMDKETPGGRVIHTTVKGALFSIQRLYTRRFDE